MDIQPNAFSAQLYEAARRIGETPRADEAGLTASESFAETLARAASELTATLGRGERAAVDAVSGQGDVQQVVEALAATELALQTAVTVRDRVVEAYQEVLRMPV
ncbi:MAG: flagellar hook-basal body complex protein FliE [Paracoccaceae bacterium]